MIRLFISHQLLMWSLLFNNTLDCLSAASIHFSSSKHFTLYLSIQYHHKSMYIFFSKHNTSSAISSLLNTEWIAIFHNASFFKVRVVCAMYTGSLYHLNICCAFEVRGCYVLYSIVLLASFFVFRDLCLYIGM